MTEAESKTKWCPFAQFVTFRDREGRTRALSNRESFTPADDPNVPSDRCLGSQCMAWRKHPALGDEHGRCGLTNWTRRVPDMTIAKLQHRVTRLERDLYTACEAVDRLKCENARLQRERRPE